MKQKANNILNFEILRVMILLYLAVMVPLLCYSRLSYGGGIARANIPFEGTASGGTLVVGYVPNPHIVHFTNVSINTSAGESADSVVHRLAWAIASSKGIFGSTAADPNVEVARTALGSTLSIVGTLREFILAGTETGLGIPKPPLNLSCSYNKQSRTIEVKWINPPDDCQYDSLYIIWRYSDVRWRDTPLQGGGDILPGPPNRYTIQIPAEVAEVGDLDMDIWLKGLRHETPVVEFHSPLGKNAIPSNVTAIHMTANGYCQEELNGIPFTAGVAPNWSAWSTAEKIDKEAFEQGDKYVGVRLYKPVSSFLSKPYYQIINAPPKGAVHGVYRKFLGLTLGHTYRLTACVSTLNMDSVKGNWSFSIHAAPTGTDGKDLTVRQMAGLASLPNGKNGKSSPEAAQIAAYGPDRTTKREFDLAITGYTKLKDDTTSSHITLPPDVNEITVWLRFSCEDPNGKVGFSGVKLEDLTAIKKPKSPQQTIQEEKQQEAKLQKWIERESLLKQPDEK